MPRTDNPVHDLSTPQLQRLSNSLREVRASAGLSYRALAPLAHYSTASLSQAAAGRKLPTWEITWAYVSACDENAERSHWRSMWESAAQAEAEQANAPARTTPEETDTADTAPERRRVQVSIADLVREEVNRQQQAPVPSALDIDTVRMALALCTTAADFRSLLIDLAGDLSPAEIKNRARVKNRVLGKRDIRAILEGPTVPTTEPLHAYLLACEVEQRYIHEWHNTATRLRISQVQFNEPAPGRRRFTVGDGLRSARRHLNIDTIVNLVTLLLMIIQLYKYGV